MKELVDSTKKKKVKTKVIDLFDLADGFVVKIYGDQNDSGISLPLLEPDKVYDKILHKWAEKVKEYSKEGHSYKYHLFTPHTPEDLTYCKLCLYDVTDNEYLYSMRFNIKKLSDAIMENYFDSNIDFYILDELIQYFNGYRPIASKLEIV